MIGQSIGAYTDATHGMTLSAISKAYYSYIMPGRYKVLTKGEVIGLLKQSM